MPVLEDGLSSGHASDTENNNPNSISMQKDHREMDVNEKYIDSSLDNPQTLISAIQTSVGSINNQQKPPRNSVALGYGISVDNDEIIASNNVAPMKNNKETSLINAINSSASAAATSPSLIPSMAGMNSTASHINTPVLSVAPNNTAPSSAVNQLLNNQKRNQQPNSNNLTNFLTSSQLPAPTLGNSVMMSSPGSHERELKDVTNHIIQNNITNSSRQQASNSMNMSKKGDIDLDSLYSTLSKFEILSQLYWTLTIYNDFQTLSSQLLLRPPPFPIEFQRDLVLIMPANTKMRSRTH